MSGRLRVAIACPGVGSVHRGYESFASELAIATAELPGLSVRLYGGRYRHPDPWGRRLPIFKRNKWVAKWLGSLLGRDGYWVEQLSFALSLMFATCLWRPSIIFTSDRNVATTLMRMRGLTRSRARLLFSNGGPFGPPFYYADHVHQVSPEHLSQALQAGEDRARHTLIPYGFYLPPIEAEFGIQDELRESLDLAHVNGPLVLSVCALNKLHVGQHT